MEMDKARLIFVLFFSLAVSCAPRFEWRKFEMDGHRTGAEGVSGPDFVSALGYTDSVYHAPNGRVFSSPAVVGTAEALLKVQPQMSRLKKPLAFCPVSMTTGEPESLLGNWAADAVALAASSIYHRPVDVALMNLGGIRMDMPEGDVLLDDVLSMFPFNNDIVYVSLKGRDLRTLMEDMVSRRIQAVSGVRMVVKDNTLQNIEVGGEPLDDDRVYGLATIDFLLEGGDHIYASRNALVVYHEKVKVKDWMVPYIRAIGASGGVIESALDGRVKVL